MLIFFRNSPELITVGPTDTLVQLYYLLQTLSRVRKACHITVVVVPCCSSVFWRAVVCHVDSYEPVMSVAIGRENDRDFHIVVTLGPEDCEAPLSSIELKGVGRETLASVTALAVTC